VPDDSPIATMLNRPGQIYVAVGKTDGSEHRYFKGE